MVNALFALKEESLHALGRRRRFVHGPTPIVRMPRLADRLGLDLWIKRDDASGGAEAGNKLRKLEYLVADALSQGADTLVTGGHVQSNHARTTAIVAATLGLRCALSLWSDKEHASVPATGNALIDRMVGAEIELLGPVPVSQRAAALGEAAARIARRGGRPYTIPEGGSNGVGALGYVQACREIRKQLDAGLANGSSFDVIVHACGSGGTAAGLAAGAHAFNVAQSVHAMAIVPDSTSLRHAVGRIIGEIGRLMPDLGPPSAWTVDPRGQDGAESLSVAQRRFMVEMARYGLILDPVYTGKAFWGLARAVHEDGRWVGKRVLFIHTGGLPGLFSQDFGLVDP
jgi:D-cysteine desulfhydrase